MIINNTDVKSMVEEFLILENMENNFSLDGLEDKAQKANVKKWNIKKVS